MSYNFGYFLGIGMGFFSLFSLSEHLVFALAALPIAVGGAILLLVGFWLMRQADRIREGVVRSPKRGSMFWVLIAVLALCVFGLEAYGIYSLSGSLGILAAGMIVSCSIFIAHKLPKESSREVAVAILVLTCGGVALAIDGGFEIARLTLNESNYFYRVNGDERSGTLLIGGQYGVLFYDSEKRQIVFLKWDHVKDIERTRAQKGG